MTSTTAPIETASTPQWRNLLQMTKPTIGLLVVITAIPSLLLAEKAMPSLKVILGCLAGTMLASMSAGVFNHLVDAGLDFKMARTKRRPLPSGNTNPTQAAITATALGAISFTLLVLTTTWTAAWIALAANAFYVLIYTKFLKPRTPQNIVWGGAAGCVGPLIGWASVTGGVAWPALVLFGIIFAWTPPHFWALALKYKGDYAQAGIPMYPVVYGDEKTRKAILGYTLTLVPLVISLFVFRAAGMVYLFPALAMTLYFVWLALRLYREHSNERAMGFFYYSCIYLFGVFGALALDSLITRLLAHS